MVVGSMLICAAAWFYPQMDLEIYRLNKMREETDNVGMRAAHPGEVAEKTKRIGGNLAKNEIAPVGTPYVFGWELIALKRAGYTKEFFDGLEKVFGAMLNERHTTTFWEGYDAKEKGDEMYRFYGRPFAKSLCHVWSAWPAFIFASEVMGVKPTSDGWQTYEQKPMSGVSGFHATIPTPRGMLEMQSGCAS